MDDVVAESIKKILEELAQPIKPTSRSRVWKNPEGYKFLTQWSNLGLLRILIRKFTKNLDRSEYRLKNQDNDASRSAISTLEEGWKRPTTSQYLDFLGFTQASLEEIKGDVTRWIQDNFIKSVPKSSLADLGIDLGLWNEWCRDPINSLKILYFPLKNNKGNYRNLKEIKGEDLTYEIFIELINKTDWLLRKLVESLEKKLNDDRKYYQVEQARIKDIAKGKR